MNDSEMQESIVKTMKRYDEASEKKKRHMMLAAINLLAVLQKKNKEIMESLSEDLEV